MGEVTAEIGIASAEQRLFLGARELLNGEVLGVEFAPAAIVDVLMIRRLPHLARILEDILAAPEDGVKHCLRQAGDEAQADQEIVLAAVSKDGDALYHAAENLKADREIVLAAVSKDGGALYFAAEDLKADREIVLAAVSG